MNSDEDRFGARLRHERERRCMTQAQVAAALESRHGISLHPSAIAKMETRDVARPRTIRLNEARAVASVFGLTVSEMTSEPAPEPRVRCTLCGGVGRILASEATV